MQQFLLLLRFVACFYYYLVTIYAVPILNYYWLLLLCCVAVLLRSCWRPNTTFQWNWIVDDTQSLVHEYLLVWIQLYGKIRLVTRTFDAGKILILRRSWTFASTRTSTQFSKMGCEYVINCLNWYFEIEKFAANPSVITFVTVNRANSTGGSSYRIKETLMLSTLFLFAIIPTSFPHHSHITPTSFPHRSHITPTSSH